MEGTTGCSLKAPARPDGCFAQLKTRDSSNLDISESADGRHVREPPTLADRATLCGLYLILDGTFLNIMPALTCNQRQIAQAHTAPAPLFSRALGVLRTKRTYSNALLGTTQLAGRTAYISLSAEATIFVHGKACCDTNTSSVVLGLTSRRYPFGLCLPCQTHMINIAP